MNRRTEFRDALIGVLVGNGVTDYRVETGKKHQRLYFTVAGIQQFYVFSGSPSDTRALPNAIADLRRMLPARKVPDCTIGTKRKQKNAAPARAAQMPTSFTILPDPWEPLRRLRSMCPIPWWRKEAEQRKRPRPVS